MADKQKPETLLKALERFQRQKPQLEVTKLPDTDPKPGKNGYPPQTEWPTELYIDSKKYPWLPNVKAGQEIYLIVRAKVDEITTHDKAEANEPAITGKLTLLEVGKWGG